MEAVTTLPRSGLTRDDLAALVPEEPDDGHRYELIDGTLIVTPAPSWRHQAVSVQLVVRLHAECPSELCVLHAPFAVGLGIDTEVQPDLLVAPRDAFTDKDLPGAPLLAVEPRLTAWELHDGTYVEAADVGPDETWTAEQPFTVTLSPGDLVG